MSARKDEKCETPIFLSRNKAINTIHDKLQAFLKLLEFRIIGSASGSRERRYREEYARYDIVGGVE
jgi:hypothetical protein